jgi:metallo-beta-lactamase class B
MLLAAVLAGLSWAAPGPDAAAGHEAAARAAAGREHLALFEALCAPAPGPTRLEPPPPVSERASAPAKAFDELFWVGEKDLSAWAVGGRRGLAVIDALFDDSVEPVLVSGLRALDLDPEAIKYVIVTHGHLDHYGGASRLQERYGSRVLVSAADRALIESPRSRGPKPRRDLTAVDGQRLDVGGARLTLHATPGHTPGTLSVLISAHDAGRPHVAALWGGTAFNFELTRENFLAYIASARRFSRLAEAAGADVILSNHPKFDGTHAKLARLENRRAGEAHPFVVGAESVARYLTVARECAEANLARLESAEGRGD